MNSLLIVLLVASVNAGSFKVGNIKCTYGPSYWCENYKQAAECDAIQHCKEKVWKQKIVPLKKVDIKVTCTECKLAVDGFRIQLANPAFQKEILAKLEGVCVRFSALAPECRALIEKNAPLIFKELIKMLNDSTKVCTELGLCKASKEKIMAVLLEKAIADKMKSFKGIVMKTHASRDPPKSIPVKASAECILCEFIASKLDQTLTKNSTEKEIEDAVKNVCRLLPATIEDECTKFVQEYSAEIIQLLAQELQPKMLCTALGLCTSKRMKTLKSNGEICDICTTVLTYFKNLLQDNTTEGEIVDGLKELCGYLPEQIKSQCTAAVSQYGMALLKLIASSDPKTLCSDVGLCTSKVKKIHDAALKDKCYFGVSYWCASHANAIACKKTAYCLKYGWLQKQ